MPDPRVAIYYDVLPSTGMRNDGPPFYLTYNLKKILGRANAEHLSPIGDLTRSGTFDLNILVDYGEDGLAIPLDWELPHPSVYWVSDTHIDKAGYEYRLNRAKQFDTVFCCQRRAVSDFKAAGIKNVHWLPHAAEPDLYKPVAIMEKFDWGFIGHLNGAKRIELLDRMLKEFPKAYIGWRQSAFPGYNVFEDANLKYNQFKVIPNQTIGDDISMRIFEVLSAKRLLLVNDIPSLPDLFDYGNHLVVYQDLDDAVAKMRHYIEAETERKLIALNGYYEVVSKHTYKHRALEILEKCIDYKPKGVLQPC